MPKHRTQMPDTVSDVNGARVGVGPVTAMTRRQVRAAQLVVASTALGDAEREPDLPEVLRALGILNREARVSPAHARPLTGLKRRLTFDAREPSGRRSRAAKKVRM